MFRVLGSRLWLRLAATFVAASTLPILGAFVLTTRLLETSVRSDAAQREAALATLGATLVRDFIARGHEKITTVGRLLAQENDPRNDEDYRKTVIARLNNLVEPPDAYLELDFFAKDGEIVVNAPQAAFEDAQVAQRGREGQQMSQMVRNRENARAKIVTTPLELGKPFVGDLQQSFGFAALPVSVPMKRGDRALGAVVAYLDLRRVSALLAPLAEGGYSVRLEDGSGHAIATAGEPSSPSLGERRPAGHADWTLEVREPAARVYAAVESVRGQVELWVGVGCVLAFGLSLVMAARIVSPLSALSQTARAMESGDLAARTGIVRGDEIGALAQNFDRMAASLERLDDAKSEFVSSVSHELRTPLTAMRLSIANLLDGVVGPVTDDQKTTLTRLRGDVDRLIRLVNDLLEMARLDAGAVVARREPLDLAAVAREVAAALEPLAREKRVAVTVAGEGRIEGDRSLLHRVVSNLVDNAIKFTPEGGRVAVEVRALEGPKPGSPRTELRVLDQGPGVSNPRLFEMFAQAPVEGVKPRGTGLGLAIVKKLVALHGGTVRSEPHDGGACFVVSL